MADDIPYSEKVAIAKEFLKHSPPGEFNNVFDDISVILDKNLETVEGVPEASLDYHQDNLTSIFTDEQKQEQYQQYLKTKHSAKSGIRAFAGDGGQKSEFETSHGNALISGPSHVEGNTFHDPKSDTIFDFSPVSQSISNVRQAPSHLKSTSSEPLRQAFQTEADTYVTKHYPKGIAAVYPRLDDNNENEEFIILIEDHEFQPQNRWNGKWRSEWMATVGGDGNIYLQGGAKVHVHYYEDSNVQLVTKQSYDQILIEGINSSSNKAALAQGVVKILKKLEGRYQTSLRDNYNTMDDTTFKALRRKLPISKTKFNWENIDALRIGKEISQ